MKNIITSLQNPTIKNIVKLRKQSKRKRDSLIVVEGEKELSLAILGNIKLEQIFYCEDYSFDRNILSAISEVDIIKLSKDVFNKISIRENPDGILALAKTPNKKLDQINVQDNSLFIVLESIEKPGNLGAIIRTAEAVGIDSIILIDPIIDFYNHNVIRASRGSVFTSQVVSSPKNDFFDWIHKNQIQTFAMTPHTDKIHTDVNFLGKSAILIGNEHDGLSEEVLNLSKNKIKIPMFGEIDSLNASVSAAVVLYEAIRQRG